MVNTSKNKNSTRHIFAVFCFIFAVWAVYRYLPAFLPDWAEEIILKPIIWLPPVFIALKQIGGKGLSALGITGKNLFPSLYWGIGLGLVFAFEGLITNIFKYQGLNLTADVGQNFLWLFVVSVVTATVEETVFRGFIFNQLARLWQNELTANLISSLLFVMIHLPVGIFTLGYAPLTLSVYLALIFFFAFGSAFVFARTQNLVSSILVHLLWGWPIILFR